jgi:hypothetical protein
MSDHEAIVREFLVWAESIDRSNDHWWFPDTEGLVETHDALVAERDAANVEWHRIRGLHAAAIADLRVVVAERDAALADLADERNDSVQDKDYIVQLKADNKRLRDALEQIGSKDFDMTELGRIARAALSSWDEA